MQHLSMSAMDQEYLNKCEIALKEIRSAQKQCCFECLRKQKESKINAEHWLSNLEKEEMN